MKTAKVRELKDTGCKEPSKGTSKGRHDDVERDTESKFASSIPSGKIVCDTRHHSSFEHTEQESDCRDGMDVVAKCCANRADSESKRNGW